MYIIEKINFDGITGNFYPDFSFTDLKKITCNN